ncbi:uncharacterized protein LOC117109794 [Anneissia japonica]|uniref:uncharacterized protein LOC117109794 n=1 Tax=Anneissia japonica TaxID=1529436 RepID=UPI001425578C|nr:uncharacterized protein LOC117109794 [Anneissia japonica]
MREKEYARRMEEMEKRMIEEDGDIRQGSEGRKELVEEVNEEQREHAERMDSEEQRNEIEEIREVSEDEREHVERLCREIVNEDIMEGTSGEEITEGRRERQKIIGLPDTTMLQTMIQEAVQAAMIGFKQVSTG